MSIRKVAAQRAHTGPTSLTVPKGGASLLPRSPATPIVVTNNNPMPTTRREARVVRPKG